MKMGTSGSGKVRARFDRADANRTNSLNRARECAALTDPSILPPLSQTEDAKLPENFQSVGSNGITVMAGKMLTALFPAGLPWFNLTPSVKVTNNKALPDEALQKFAEELWMQEIAIMAILESAHIADDADAIAGFRSAKRQAIEQLLVTGDVLEYLDAEYQLTVFRRDQYVTVRDSRGWVMYHVIRENLDARELTDDQRTMAGVEIPDEDDGDDCCVDIHTLVMWQPDSRDWKITQEINGHEINSTTEKISPYFSTPFKLSPRENYGRGLVERNFGALRSYDAMCQRTIEFSIAASKHMPMIDSGSNLQAEDFAKPTGTPIEGARVENGIIQDVAFLKVDKLGDFTVVQKSKEDIRRDLGKAFLLDTENIRDSERTTAVEVNVTINEVNGATAGGYAPIADFQQVPLIRRVLFQMKKDKLLKPLPDGAIEIKVLTGIAALSRQAQAQSILSIADVVTKLGAVMPEIIEKVDGGVLIDVIRRYQNVNEPGLIRTNEEVAQRRQEAMKAQAQMQANQKAIDVVGNAAESRMTQGTTANA